MMIYNNVWLTLENTVALSWKTWWLWLIGGGEGAEPALDSFGKNAMRKLVDKDYYYKVWKKATIGPKDWRLLSVYNVTQQQIDNMYSQYGDAEVGGDFGVAGRWTWQDEDAVSAYDSSITWYPEKILKFMPDECVDPPDCMTTQPATVIWDVNLLAGQPPREIPSQP